MRQIDQVYLDYAATTPVDERVMQAMLPYFSDNFGNPSSIHTFGQRAEAALEEARHEVAQAINAQPGEVIFTSCGTESDNLALRGAARDMREIKGASHILTSPVEHHAVSHTIHQMCEQEGFTFDYLPVDIHGMVHPEEVEAAIRPDTGLVSVIYANNEIGTVNPICEIGEICRRRGVTFHTDAVQAAAHLPMDVVRDEVDLLAIGAHKFYGPKGVGALFVRHGIHIASTQTGGSQENGLRAGTQNIPLIIGMARAMHLAQTERAQRSARLAGLRDQILERVTSDIPDSRITGHPSQRLPNHASFVFEGVNGNRLLMMLDLAGFACSSGSACKVGTPAISEVLTAIGIAPNWGLGSLRVTLGRDTTQEQVDAFLAVLPKKVIEARKVGRQNG